MRHMFISLLKLGWRVNWATTTTKSAVKKNFQELIGNDVFFLHQSGRLEIICPIYMTIGCLKDAPAASLSSANKFETRDVTDDPALEDMYMGKTANILRQEIMMIPLQKNIQIVTRSTSMEDSATFLPQKLLTFIQIIMEGTSFDADVMDSAKNDRVRR